MLYHGVPINSEMIAIAFGILAWIIRGIVRGLKRISRQAVPPVLPQASLTPQNPFQAQTEPAERPASADRDRPRRLEAGGPAVPVEADRQGFVRQEQELFASEPVALGVSLTSSASPAAVPNALFGRTDDLVRAIILQEILGPPLSRRSRHPEPAPSQPSA